MTLRKLDVWNFRNYEVLEFEPDKKTLIVGRNGQGKTNLLEALAFLIRGASFRVSCPEAFIKTSCSEGMISTEWEEDLSLHQEEKILQKRTKFSDHRGLRHRVKVSLEKVGTKQVFIDRKKTNFRFISSLYPLVLFSPESLSLLKNSPESRRQWMDAWLVMRGQSAIVWAFRRAFRQKQGLLSRIRKGHITKQSSRTLLESANECFIKHSLQLAVARKKALGELLPYVKEGADCLFFGSGRSEFLVKEKSAFLGLQYMAKGMEDGEVLTEKGFQVLIEKRFNQEWEGGCCIYGAHRDDFKILFHNEDAKYYCSQGQMRGLLLALVTGQAGWYSREKKCQPLLLLDDVFSEIDKIFSSNLLNYLDKFPAQMLLTATQIPEFFSKRRDFTIFSLHKKV